MSYGQEVQTKLERVRTLMAAQGVGVLWLRRVDNVAWITGGVDTAVNIADATGIASVVIRPDSAIMVTTTIEAPRLRAEDDVIGRGFELRVSPWEQPAAVDIGGTLGVDVPLADAKDVSRDLRVLRAQLLPVEIERFRALGKACAAAMSAAIERTRPGMSEWQISAALADEVRSRAVTPIVVLIATDERIHRVRHPLPLDKKLDKYAMLVLCGRKDGLVCSITRLVHYGALSDDLRRRMQACAEVDATMIAASQPGATMGRIFKITQDAYARAGYADEWKLHHQGGNAGYGAREIIATPGDQTALVAGMTCAWNPSITGVKCEDTVLVKAQGAPDILTVIEGWPVVPVQIDGTAIERPLILEFS
jgi:Xaa-Pro aminopeptidase